ncbi:hypothetical protein Tco_1246204 [Tanacetum coccineum]
MFGHSKWLVASANQKREVLEALEDLYITRSSRLEGYRAAIVPEAPGVVEVGRLCSWLKDIAPHSDVEDLFNVVDDGVEKVYLVRRRFDLELSVPFVYISWEKVQKERKAGHHFKYWGPCLTSGSTWNPPADGTKSTKASIQHLQIAYNTTKASFQGQALEGRPQGSGTYDCGGDQCGHVPEEIIR